MSLVAATAPEVTKAMMAGIVVTGVVIPVHPGARTEPERAEAEEANIRCIPAFTRPAWQAADENEPKDRDNKQKADGFDNRHENALLVAATSCPIIAQPTGISEPRGPGEIGAAP